MFRTLLWWTLVTGLLLALLPTRAANPLDPAVGFNALVQGDVAMLSGHAEGPVALGGNYRFVGGSLANNYTVSPGYTGSGYIPLGSTDTRPTVLVVGGNLDLAHSSQTHQILQSGYVKIGTMTGLKVHAAANMTYINGDTANQNTTPRLSLTAAQSAASVAQPHGLNFTAAFANLTDYSAQMAALTASGKVAVRTGADLGLNSPNQTIAMALTANKLNVFNVTASQLNHIQNINWNQQPSATQPVVWNVTTTGDFTWTGAGFNSLSDDAAKYMLFNFHRAEGLLTVPGNSTIVGTLFAPRAEVIKNGGGNLAGQVVARKFTMNGGELHPRAFLADLPITADCSSSPVAVGNDWIAFRGVRTDYPQAGRSTWYYAVVSGTKPTISHVSFALTCPTIRILDAGTWNGSNLNALTSGGGTPEPGPGSWPAAPTTDPTSGVTGIKFDQGFEDNELRYYYFTVSGNPPVTPIAVASKGGKTYDLGTVCGPSPDCGPSCAGARAQMSQECQDGSPTLLRFLGVDFPSGSYRVRLYPSTIVGSAANGEILAVTGQLNQFYYVEDAAGACDAQVGPFIPVSIDCEEQSLCGPGGLFDLATMGFTGPFFLSGEPPNGNFNALVGGSFTTDGTGDSEGRLAVGGNFTAPSSGSGFTVGGGSPLGTGGLNAPWGWDNFIVGGTMTGKVGVRGNSVLNGTSALVYAIGTTYGGLIRSDLDVAADVLDVSGAIAAFRTLSTELGGCAGGALGTVSVAGDLVTLDGLGASGLVRFELATLAGATSFNFVNLDEAAAILINVRGSSPTLSAGAIFLEGTMINYPMEGASLDLLARVLWNFPEASTFTLNSYLLIGSVLAPHTTQVTLTGGGINGQTVWGGNVNQGGGFEFHNFCFVASFSGCQVASISGSVYDDAETLADQNTDRPIPGVTIELHRDDDCDGAPDDPESPWRTTTTGSSGYYEFLNVPIGQCYVIVERDPEGYLSSDDVFALPDDNLIALEVIEPRPHPLNNFWDYIPADLSDEFFDLGDLPDTTSATATGDYQTLLTNDGPRHLLASPDPGAGLRLGALIDAEVDGQPHPAATGDDLAGVDDEDGVQIPSLTIGQTAVIRVTVANAPSGGANLFAFFDWNRDGAFDDTAEALAPVVVQNGLNQFSVAVPMGLTANVPLGARFRLSTTAALSWTGSAPDGEVEDYLVTLQSTPTAATLSYFRAHVTGAGHVRLEWGTLVEVRTLGFYLEREESGSVWRRLDNSILPAEGFDRLPHRYNQVDSTANPHSAPRYRLVEIEVDGQERVLAVTQAIAPTVTRLTWKHGAGQIELQGTPNLEVVVESAGSVQGPWAEMGRVVLDQEGLGNFGSGAQTSDPARFFRILSR